MYCGNMVPRLFVWGSKDPGRSWSCDSSVRQADERFLIRF